MCKEMFKCFNIIITIYDMFYDLCVLITKHVIFLNKKQIKNSLIVFLVFNDIK